MTYSTLLYSTLLYSTLLYSTLLYSTLIYYTLLYSTLLYSTLIYSTLLYSYILYSTVLYSTLLYSVLDKQFPVEQCEATVSQSTVLSPPLCSGARKSCPQWTKCTPLGPKSPLRRTLGPPGHCSRPGEDFPAAPPGGAVTARHDVAGRVMPVSETKRSHDAPGPAGVSAERFDSSRPTEARTGGVGNFTSQDFDIFLCCFCADSSSPQISAILVGHFSQRKMTVSRNLRKTSTTLPQRLRASVADTHIALAS